MSKALAGSTIRIHCTNLCDDEVAALRRLLGLLSNHLRFPCEVIADPVAADLVLLNVDLPGGDTPGFGPARVIGCALKPTAHPAARIHRPLRAYELLAVLSEVQPVAVPAGSLAPSHGHDRRYSLREWPLDLGAWSRDQIAIMAAISGDTRTAQAIALRTGYALTLVQTCLDELLRQGLADQEASAPTSIPVAVAPHRGWQKLARRVGQILGFGR